MRLSLFALLAISPAFAEPPAADAVKAIDPRVLPADSDSPKLLRADANKRVAEAVARENAAWGKVRTAAEWESFRDARIGKLSAAIGEFPPVPKAMSVKTTGEVRGDGFVIENVVYESRPGLWVTANLYRPAKPPAKMPCIVISHSHHNPKTEGELQDMGMTWARAGCLVLVPDHLGHGERRQHPFRTADDFPKPFRVSRQDYFHRYMVGTQLDLIGDSLIGWLAWDLSRGIDVLHARPGADKSKTILLGAVAGGGDPAGVAAALDPRVTAVAPFNFGSPQPEDYPIPADAETKFRYFGEPYWETTRCIRRGPLDGFAHWVIVASVAPRRYVHSSEFAWDKDRDPVYPRIRKVFELEKAADNLAVAHGRGSLKGRPPESSHCNNIGALHREGLHAAFAKWFDMPVPKEYSKRVPAKDLWCLTTPVAGVTPKLAHEVASATVDKLARKRTPDESRMAFLAALGPCEPAGAAKVLSAKPTTAAGITTERITLEPEPGVVIPLLMLKPEKAAGKLPLVVGFAQDGKGGFLTHRAEDIAALLKAGFAVALPDVRGTGETKSGSGSGRHWSDRTSASLKEWQIGRTLLGLRLADARAVVRYLKTRGDIDPKGLRLWGDSFAATNPIGKDLATPMEVDPFPTLGEPLGALLAILVPHCEPDIAAVLARGGLKSYRSLLDAPRFYVPHDVLAPGVFRAGDIPELVAALGDIPHRYDDAIDGQNRPVPQPATLRAADWLLSPLPKK